MIDLDLQPELEAQLALEAKSFGLSIEKYPEQIITDHLSEVGSIETRAETNQSMEDIAAGPTRTGRWPTHPCPIHRSLTAMSGFPSQIPTRLS